MSARCSNPPATTCPTSAICCSWTPGAVRSPAYCRRRVAVGSGGPAVLCRASAQPVWQPLRRQACPGRRRRMDPGRQPSSHRCPRRVWRHRRGDHRSVVLPLVLRRCRPARSPRLGPVGNDRPGHGEQQRLCRHARGRGGNRANGLDRVALRDFDDTDRLHGPPAAGRDRSVGGVRPHRGLAAAGGRQYRQIRGHDPLARRQPGAAGRRDPRRCCCGGNTHGSGTHGHAPGPGVAAGRGQPSFRITCSTYSRARPSWRVRGPSWRR